MLQFIPLEKENLLSLQPWFAAQKTHISDFSLGYQYMWSEMLSPAYATWGDCLILAEHFHGNFYVHYPLSLSGSEEEELRAIEQIELYCRDNTVRLRFVNVPRQRLSGMVFRYGADVHISDNRRWKDYLYLAEDFRSYEGGKYSGQRNHVNKFKKKYPDWEFRPYTSSDEAGIVAFLNEFSSVQNKKNSIAREELKEVFDLLPNLEKFGMCCGVLTVGRKIVGFSVGERCGDMVVVHIEKALRGYEGAYPMLAQQFALRFTQGVVYLNRMDDAGDLGLRKSKMQYLPVEIVSKYSMEPKRAIDTVSRLPVIRTERLKLKTIGDEYGEAYRRLASDTGRNRYWGYDYREDTSEKNPSAAWFLSLVREDFHLRHEMSLGIFLGKELIGEAVLHRFGYEKEAEIGMRLLPEYEGFGYAKEATSAYIAYAFARLGLERVEAKCNKENERSAKTLLSDGMRKCGEDDKYFYFEKTPSM